MLQFLYDIKNEPKAVERAAVHDESDRMTVSTKYL